jgi:hypothetical protein
MPPLTLVQKRALIAAANNVNKKERAFGRAGSVPWSQRSQEENKKYRATARQWRDARELLTRLEEKIGVNGTTVNYHLMSQNVIANVLKKHKFAEPLIARAKATMWRKGLEAEMERARANFRNFEKGVFHQKINLIGESHRKKTPSPPKRASPRRTSPPPANNAHRRIHGIGPANNTRITWSRNANGKVLIYQTLSKLQLRLTNAQRNALSKMSENQAMNTIRQLARQR